MASYPIAVMPSAYETCFPPITQTTVELTKSNGGWNDFATGFINGISNGISNDLIEQIGNLIFGSGGNIGDVATGLLNSQAGIITFIVIGGLFSLISLLGAVSTCIWACTCRRRSKGVASSCMNFTGIFIAFVSFGFVVAGVTLYGMSIDSFVNGILKAPNQLSVIFSNVNSFTVGAASQVGCAVTNGFSNISSEVVKIPDEIVNLFDSSPDVLDVMGPNYKAISKTFSDNKPAVDDILANLNKALRNVNIAGNIDAKNAVEAALTSYSAFDDALAPGNLPTVLTQLSTQTSVFQASMDTLIKAQAGPIAADASKTFTDMINTVNVVVDNLTKTIDGVVGLVDNVLDFMSKLEQRLNEHDEITGWITTGIKAIISTPSVVALLAAALAILCGVWLACKKKSIPSRGCCSASCTLITLTIAVLAIACVVMIPATLLMTLGYGTQLVCQPFFYDPNLEALKAVDNLFGTITIPSMTPGKQVQLKFSEVMSSCEATRTFMQAVKGDEIIDVSVITKGINVTDLTNKLNNTIDGSTITPLSDTNFAALTAVLGSLDLVPDLSAAQKVDPTEIAAIIAQMNALNTILNPSITVCNTAAKSAEHFTDEIQIKALLKSTSSNMINTIFADLTVTANLFKNDLIFKSAPCTPVYQSYEDVGMLGCEQMAGGIQGMWAAAGLAAIFFVPTVLAVLFVASALRGGKMKKMSAQPVIVVGDQFQAISTPPVYSGYPPNAYPVVSQAKPDEAWDSPTSNSRF